MKFLLLKIVISSGLLLSLKYVHAQENEPTTPETTEPPTPETTEPPTPETTEPATPETTEPTTPKTTESTTTPAITESTTTPAATKSNIPTKTTTKSNIPTKTTTTKSNIPTTTTTTTTTTTPTTTTKSNIPTTSSSSEEYEYYSYEYYYVDYYDYVDLLSYLLDGFLLREKRDVQAVKTKAIVKENTYPKKYNPKEYGIVNVKDIISKKLLSDPNKENVMRKKDAKDKINFIKKLKKDESNRFNEVSSTSTRDTIWKNPNEKGEYEMQNFNIEFDDGELNDNSNYFDKEDEMMQMFEISARDKRNVKEQALKMKSDYQMPSDPKQQQPNLLEIVDEPMSESVILLMNPKEDKFESDQKKGSVVWPSRRIFRRSLAEDIKERV